MLLDPNQIQKLVELTKQQIVEIREEGQSTVIEFADGQVIPLYGGGAEILDAMPVTTCSFCGGEQSEENPLMAPPGKSSPCICSHCACRAVEIFVEHGIDVELDAKIPKGEE